MYLAGNRHYPAGNRDSHSVFVMYLAGDYHFHSSFGI